MGSQMREEDPRKPQSWVQGQSLAERWCIR